jgi:hypothetical protein
VTGLIIDSTAAACEQAAWSGEADPWKRIVRVCMFDSFPRIRSPAPAADAAAVESIAPRL